MLIETSALRLARLFASAGAVGLWLALAGPVEANELPKYILAVGDIAKCSGDDSWLEEFQELLGIRPEDGAPEPFFEELLELLRLKEETGYPAAAEATAKLAERLPGTILAVGDLAYSSGSAAEFQECYDRVWGKLKDRIRPVPGNHEYRRDGAKPYYSYWGAQAGESGLGYYSFDLGAWHIVALNSNIDAETGSVQYRWLQHDLAETELRCVLAYWHHPIFSSGPHGNPKRMKDAYRLLYEFGASVVISGHDHDYERFAPQDPQGTPDLVQGIRVFVVGTGGASLNKRQKVEDNSQSFISDSLGMLKLSLGRHYYTWEFVTADEERIRDAGQAACVDRSMPN